MSVPQRISFLVGWAGEPARRRLIENGATSQLLQTLTFWQSFLINIVGVFWQPTTAQPDKDPWYSCTK
jgi:hypothetical protein